MIEEHMNLEKMDTLFICGPDGFVEHICGGGVPKNARNFEQLNSSTSPCDAASVISPSKHIAGLLGEVNLHVDETKVIVF